MHGTPQSARNSSYSKHRWGDNSFVKKTNLPDRKKEVLRIAAENYKIVQRLQRVQSALSSRTTRSNSARKYDSRPKSSLLQSYPNVTDPKNLTMRHGRKISTNMKKSAT